MPASHATRSLRSACIAMLLLALAPAVCGAGTLVIPRIAERSGTIGENGYSFDTTLYISWSAGLGGSGAGTRGTVNLFLYDAQTNDLMRSASNAPVCNPCS